MKKLKIVILLIFIFISIYFIITYNKYHEYYLNRLKYKTSKIVSLKSAPRGNIYDKNGILLVGNKLTKNLVLTSKNEDEIKNILKQINKLFPNKSIKTLNNIVNKGYIYEDKILIEDLTDEMVQNILNSNINGITINEGYKRYYPYKDTLKNIFGSVSKITKENKDYYLKKGYDLNDEVGVSGLELEYEEYLKGVKAKYKVNADNSLTLISKEKKGNDLYLSIDISLVNKINEIIDDELIKAKKMPNTDYLNDTYVIISNPNTGQIIAFNGQRYINDETFTDISLNNILSSFTLGSVVKGATISIGYKYNLIDQNKKILDSCVKLKNIQEKCSFQRLGYLNDIKALEMSSNYYQFIIAIKLTGKEYVKNMQLDVTNKEFDIYRNMLCSYGLGCKSGIDLPNEKLGLIGDKISGDLLLNLAIGQYDTYTPIELITYINTLASKGEKRKPSLVSFIKDNDRVIYQNNFEVISNVDIDKKYYDRIFEGFYNVMNKGTGKGFMNYNLHPAGKTGTSESFLDTNNDGKIDTKTITLTMAGFFPYENPKYSIMVICPHASYNNSSNEYIYSISSKISRKITNLFYENNEY